jgi:hypothetical protein
MTVNELIIELYDQLGRPSDLNPYSDDTEETVDIGSAGAVKLLGWINRAYRRVLNWRFRGGRVVRFRCTERDLYFPGIAVTGTCLGGGDNVIQFDESLSDVSHDNDAYNGWLVEITSGTGSGQVREIVDYVATYLEPEALWLTYATVSQDWETNPDITSVFSLTKNFYSFVDSDSDDASYNIPVSSDEEVIAVMRVTDSETDTQLIRADRITRFTSLVDSHGQSPTMFKDVMGGLLFDTVVPVGRYYKVRYFGMPPALSALTDVPDIPGQFHEAMLLWSVWWGLRRQQAFGDAYSTKRDLEDTMETALQQFDRGSEREELSLYLEDRYV